MKITIAAIVVVAISYSSAALSQTLNSVCKEAGDMVNKGQSQPSKTPAVVSVERMLEPGVFDDVLLVYGFGDNYAAAQELADYGRQRHKREYRAYVLKR